MGHPHLNDQLYAHNPFPSDGTLQYVPGHLQILLESCIAEEAGSKELTDTENYLQISKDK